MSEFEQLLELMSESLIHNSFDVEKLTPTAFEQKIYDYLVYRFGRSQVEYSEGSTAFPDVVVQIGARRYGIEVKLSRAKTWRTIGNSIMEGTAKPVDMIYVFMGKIDGNSLDIRFRRYESCIDNIVVTHSPRYHLDMNLQEDGNIFTKMNSSYESFRALDDRGKISEVKAYYRSQNNTDYWWIESDDNSISSPLQIKFVSDLDNEHRELLRLQLFIRYPHVVLEKSSKWFPKNTKYKDAAVWLVKQGYLHTNIRDMFSANSEQKLPYLKDYPTVYTVLFQSIPQIRSIIETMSFEDIQEISRSYIQQVVFRYEGNSTWQLWQQYVLWLLINIDEVNVVTAQRIVHDEQRMV